MYHGIGVNEVTILHFSPTLRSVGLILHEGTQSLRLKTNQLTVEGLHCRMQRSQCSESASGGVRKLFRRTDFYHADRRSATVANGVPRNGLSQPAAYETGCHSLPRTVTVCVLSVTGV